MPIPKQRFYFLRHGQTDWNVEGRFQGHTDMPLTAAGVQQAHEAANFELKPTLLQIDAGPARYKQILNRLIAQEREEASRA